MKKLFMLLTAVTLYFSACTLPLPPDALYRAAEKGDTQLVAKLIDKGYDINAAPCKGWTPVMIAAAENHPDTVAFLLEHGANPNAQNQYGRTALHFAANYALEPVAKLLLEYGADPTIKTYQSFGPEAATPTEAVLAIFTNSKRSSDREAAYNILKMFIYKTGQVNAEYQSATPLLLAVFRSDYPFAKYLVDKGANPYQLVPKSEPKGYFYELDDIVFIEENQYSPEMEALFLPYHEKKKQEQDLVIKEGLGNFQKLQNSVDSFIAKNKKLPTTKTFFKDAKVNIPQGKWNDDKTIVTPHFTYRADCDTNRCSIVLNRYEDTGKLMYYLSAFKLKPTADWTTRCVIKTKLGTGGCTALSEHIPSLETDIHSIAD